MLWVNIAGFALILLVIYWFFFSEPGTAKLDQNNPLIVVENGIYNPAKIQIPRGRKQTLTFLRKDGSPCSKTVVFPDLEISRELNQNQKTSISLPPLPAGRYPFHCQMKMYRGTLVVGGES